MKIIVLSAIWLLLLLGCFPSNGGDVEYGSHVFAVDEATFKEFLQADVAVVDFWAAWCGPCIKMKPVFSEVAKAYMDKAKFGAVDVDQNPTLAQKYNIRGIPAILIFNNGKLVDTLVGVVSKSELNKRVERAIGS